jgi:primosomal protein N' (replication factor Y)
MYAQIAIHSPVDSSFDYHIPPELDGQIAPGHLVQIPFRTAMEYGVVLSVHDTPPAFQTKPILDRLDPRPLLTADQIALALWLAETTLAPVGLCVWLLLPPGITGGRDVLVRLLRDDLDTADALEAEVLALLRRRGDLRGGQLNTALPGKKWRAAVDALAKIGAVEKVGVLAPPRVKPRSIEVAALAVHPDQITSAVGALARPSRPADLLESLLAGETVAQTRANRAALEKLAGLVTVAADGQVALAVPAESAREQINTLRKLDKPLHVLRLLAREGSAVDVSWIYAQTGAKLDDLKRLDAAHLIVLDEKDRWRDSLAQRHFVPDAPLRLTGAQAQAWQQIERALTGGEARTRQDGEARTRQDGEARTRQDGEARTRQDGEARTRQDGEARTRQDGEARTRQDGEARTRHASSLRAGGGVFLLHGVTGSGKTEIYLRAIETTLQRGRSALFLVPEIALTAQTVRRVAARFAGKVALVHSSLSDGERYDTWRRARDGAVGVIVGARSALFSPLPDIGLIILDEEHDPSYKQSPPILPPYYHTRQVAEAMMRRADGVVILGSATPDLETMKRARDGSITLLELPDRIAGAQPDSASTGLPPVHVVDMRRELKAGNTSIFSRRLQAALGEVLKRREQVILFMNRRGQATYVFCRDCGYVAACPNCDTPLTYHSAEERLRCHHCGHEQQQPERCPQCRSTRIRYFGAGTQQIEERLHVLFPTARTIRWDADTVASHEDHERILGRFVERKADILIGTQMVAKGLDVPLVTLVGVVSADMGLALPDFRANERTFQLLTQVAGRAGRGSLGGEVILQTYQPDHYAIAAAAQHDYAAFYEREIAHRRDLGYPPFRRFVRILFTDTSADKAEREARHAASLLREALSRQALTGTELIGPAPCFFTRLNRQYRWHILLRGPNPAAAFADLKIPPGWYVDLDPVEIL